jgi:hypothetical protein
LCLSTPQAPELCREQGPIHGWSRQESDSLAQASTAATRPGRSGPQTTSPVNTCPITSIPIRMGSLSNFRAHLYYCIFILLYCVLYRAGSKAQCAVDPVKKVPHGAGLGSGRGNVATPQTTQPTALPLMQTSCNGPFQPVQHEHLNG